jgi:UDP-N-acetylmuramate--alanine ligase
MDFNRIQKIYFIGIGGIGMSALARYFHRHGAAVYGYDRTETDLTRALAREGMQIHYTDDVSFIPEGIDLVVFTPAVPKDHTELQWFLERGYPVKKRAEVLGIISRAKKCIAIAGTHGKTTTSTLTTHLLRSCGIDATAFVGGISGNLGTNFVEGNSDWVVVEADEYDRSFLHLSPTLAVINSVDPDHLDIYGTAEAVLEGYRQFARQTLPEGAVFLGEQAAGQISDCPAPLSLFGIQATSAHRAGHIRVENGEMAFDYISEQYGTLPDLRLPYPGLHNVRNAVAAITVTLAAGGNRTALPAALRAFKGVKRRFETIYKDEKTVLIDDYAHHPAELEAAISAARMLYPGRHLTGIFQPHLYTRTRDFAAAFAAALDALDTCILLDIYPAREQPIPGVDSALLARLMRSPHVLVTDKAGLVDTLRQTARKEVIMTLGAGDIDNLLNPLVNFLRIP